MSTTDVWLHYHDKKEIKIIKVTSEFSKYVVADWFFVESETREPLYKGW